MRELRAFYTTQINTITIGVRTGSIKRFYATDATEKMLGRTSAELIVLETIYAAKKSKIIFGNY